MIPTLLLRGWRSLSRPRDLVMSPCAVTVLQTFDRVDDGKTLLVA